MGDEKGNDIVAGNAGARRRSDAGSRNPREWIGAVRSARMRVGLDFDLLLAELDLNQQNETGKDADAIEMDLDHAKLRRAREIENCRFQLSHKMLYRDAHLEGAESFKEDSTKPRVDAWRRKKVEPLGEDREFSARERALWQPISEGTLLPQEQHSHALLYRRHCQNAGGGSNLGQAPGALSESQPAGTEIDPPTSPRGAGNTWARQPPTPLKLWNAMSKISADVTASRVLHSKPRSNLQKMVRERCGKRPASASGCRPASASGFDRRQARACE